MDGRVAAIRAELPETPIVAYSAKYASAFYGPFREAAESAPAFGDRRGYQMDPGNVREALRECELDLAEGADVLMVKPALPYLDVIRAVRERFDAPLAAYNVTRRVRDGEGRRARRASRRARGRGREPARDQARRRRPRHLVLDEGARGLALGTRSELWRRAQELIPGGVNSPVRAMRAVGLDEPLFVRRASGSRLETADGRSYLDWVMSWGPLLFGHADPETVDAVVAAAREGTSFGAATEREVELAAEIVDAVPSVERVRLVSSGHRGVDERDPARARLHAAATACSSSRAATTATSMRCSPRPARASRRSASRRRSGVPGSVTAHTIVAPYNDAEAAAAAVAEYGEGLACIIVEPVAGNMGVVPPAPGFLQCCASSATRPARCSSSTR